MSTATYTVTGMTCAHCVSAVTGELSSLPGVTDVRIDLASGAHTVLTPDINWDIDSIDLSDDGKLLAFASEAGDCGIVDISA